MKKKIKYCLLVLATLVVFYQNSVAQDRRPLNLPRYDFQPLHFGFTLGLNTMDFTIHHSPDFYFFDTVYSIENNRLLGFNIGIVSNLRLHEYFDLRFLPGLIFGQRNLDYIFLKDTTSKKFYKHTMKIESTFLDFSLICKYKSARVNNYRAYLLGGISYKYDLAAQKKIKEEEKPKIRLKRNDFYYEVGFGLDYYLQYFKFSTELKLAVGINDVVVYDNSQFTKAFQRMNSKLLILSFHFE